MPTVCRVVIIAPIAHLPGAESEIYIFCIVRTEHLVKAAELEKLLAVDQGIGTT